MLTPEVLHSFNVYNEGNILVGTTGEITLPDFESMTSEVSGAGILGSYEDPIVGLFGSMTQEIPFRTLCKDIFSLTKPKAICNLTLRGSIQCTETSTGEVNYKPVRIVIRGRCKSFKPGKFKNGEQMDSSITLEVLYIYIEYNNKPKFELDKLNYVYKVNNKDMLEKVRSQC